MITKNGRRKVVLVRGVVRFVVQIVVHGDASECVEVELILQFQIMEKKKMAAQTSSHCAFKWWAVRDLNPRPDACKAPALPLRQPPAKINSAITSVFCHWKKGNESNCAGMHTT